jgi:GT2 family glycosyltransferase
MSNITAILTLYKRPHVLQEQIDSLRNQTFPPQQIIIWKNFADGYLFPDHIKNDTSIITIESSQNFGVWARFAVGLLANTEYICIFDDDTIPGKKWFENCLVTIKEVNGLLGTIGLIFDNKEKYSNNKRFGWDGNNETTIRVDIVGHSWFFKREWLKYLWEVTPDYNKFLRCGEDIGFSWALQKNGINTYVPPHPKNDIEMFGSIPSTAWKYGTESVGISISCDGNLNFEYAYKFFIEKDFKILSMP